MIDDMQTTQQQLHIPVIRRFIRSCQLCCGVSILSLAQGIKRPFKTKDETQLSRFRELAIIYRVASRVCRRITIAKEDSRL
jgi:hypothetical protein